MKNFKDFLKHLKVTSIEMMLLYFLKKLSLSEEKMSKLT